MRPTFNALRRALPWAQWRPTVLAGAWVVVLFGVGMLLARSFAVSIQNGLSDHAGLGVAVFVATSAVAVLMPLLTNLPLVPLAVLAWGPWWTALLLLSGWLIGAMLSFLLGRHARALILSRLPAVQRHADIERLIHPQHRLGSLVLLRMTFPVDVLSYALGLFSPATTLVQASLSTLLGAAPFALLFAFVPVWPLSMQLAVVVVSTLLFVVYAAWVLHGSPPALREG
jgi:uncharacterized membrane protein YdjX (TVP38/TMEM64 family)